MFLVIAHILWTNERHCAGPARDITRLYLSEQFFYLCNYANNEICETAAIVLINNDEYSVVGLINILQAILPNALQAILFRDAAKIQMKIIKECEIMKSTILNFGTV